MKLLQMQEHIGAVRAAVSFHDGEKRQTDGSPFFDIRTFSNIKKARAFYKDLVRQGYGEKPPAHDGFWCSSSGRIELNIPADIVDSVPLSGSADSAIAAARRDPRIVAMLAAVDPALLAAELSECGAWDDSELASHEDNLDRLLWLACCAIREGVFDRE